MYISTQVVAKPDGRKAVEVAVISFDTTIKSVLITATDRKELAQRFIAAAEALLKGLEE